MRYLFSVLVLLYSSGSYSQLHIDTSYTSTEELVLENFVNTNTGVSVYDISYNGAFQAIAGFKTVLKYNKLFDKGIILSSGDVFNAVGPNNSISASKKNSTLGFKLLEDLANGKTYDAAVLSFKFISMTDKISFRFIFASEEYPEYINKGVNDVFGFFVVDTESGYIKNMAVLPNSNDPITVDNINHKTNSEYYINVPVWDKSNIQKWENDRKNGEMAYLFQFDGLTVPIMLETNLNPFKTYEFIIAIADVGDMVYDSWVMLEANSFISNGNTVQPKPELIADYFAKNNLLNRLEISNTNNEISILSDINFRVNSYEITDESFDFLNEILIIIKHTNTTLDIIGYTDETGTEEYNMELSQKRADTVKQYFIENGISNNRINAVGKGILKAHSSNNHEENLAKNRKVEFIIK